MTEEQPQAECKEAAATAPVEAEKQNDLLALKNDIQKQLLEKLGLSSLVDLDESKASHSNDNETSGDAGNESKESNDTETRSRTSNKKNRTSPTSSATNISSTGEDTDPKADSMHGSPKVKCKFDPY